MILHKTAFLKLAALLMATSACNAQPSPAAKNKTTMQQTATGKNFTAGKDYFEFTRVKIMDNEAFTEPAEAYSILLPQGWLSEGGVFWTAPGNACAGTNVRFSAKSPDGKSSFSIYPAIIWSWSSNPQSVEMSRQFNTSQYCGVGQPVDAVQYLENVWLRELQNPGITDKKNNPEVVQAMSENDEKGRTELMRYGAAQVNYRHTAVTARLKWNDGMAGIALCGVTNTETYIPNVYNGTYDISYTSYATRMLFVFPESETAAAEKIMTVMVAGVRTNPAWKQATNDYWKDVREKKHQQHLGTIRMIDERTQQIAKSAIENGNRRLSDMDNQMRSWEARQSQQDRTHTNFIKAIREVETYRDDNGKVELSAGYDHAWSRSDGTHFIMSNNPNFDPSSVLQDNRWKEMRKVD
ncbi:hypothetical protein [Foetidibacter luteolus]|uniref:hypothetical protein n=1 Tax=Foetidibacter luteolus TaxID=2608880 RepID=UPI00129A157E|nr:hypothetical protein [Foetidibacter luteolus]